MSWRGEEGGIAAAKAGHDVIMTPGRYCYLDRYQDYPPSQPKAFGSYMSLEQCYDYNPAGQLPDSIARHILGLQGNLWTEQVPTMAQCEYMLYPRLLAIAENGWSRAKTDYADFHRRALHLQDVLVSRGYHPFDLRKEVGERAEKKPRRRIWQWARGWCIMRPTQPTIPLRAMGLWSMARVADGISKMGHGKASSGQTAWT